MNKIKLARMSKIKIHFGIMIKKYIPDFHDVCSCLLYTIDRN